MADEVSGSNRETLVSTTSRRPGGRGLPRRIVYRPSQFPKLPVLPAESPLRSHSRSVHSWSVGQAASCLAAMLIELPVFSALVGAIALLVSLARKAKSHIQYKRAQKSKGCLSPKRFKHNEPFLGLDLLVAMAKALKAHRFLHWQKELFASQNAKTFEATLLGSRMLYSSEPENMKAMSTSVEQDFGVEPIRNGNGAVTPFTSHGTSTSDGEMWKFSRNLIKPYFDRDGYRNLHRLEVHVDKLLELVPTNNSTFDLQPLLQRWVARLLNFWTKLLMR